MWWRRKEKKIGQILVDAEVITEEQLERALRIQKKNGALLGKILVDLGYVDEDELITFIAEQYRVPCVSLDRYEFSKGLLEILPEDAARTYGVVPLDVIGDILTVGIADVPDERAFKRLEELTGYKVQVMLVTTRDFNQFMRKIGNVFAERRETAGITEDESRIRTPRNAGIDRRRFPRFEKELKIRYEFGDEYHIDSTINISQGGLLIRSKCPIPINSHIVLRLELPDPHKDVIIVSKIAWSRHIEEGNVYLVGVSFISMDSSDRARLSEFIRILSSETAGQNLRT